MTPKIGMPAAKLSVPSTGSITQTGALSVAGETRIEGQQLSFTGNAALAQSAPALQVSTAEGQWVGAAVRNSIAASGTASALAGSATGKA